MTSLLDCGIYSMSYNDSILKVMTVYSKNEKYTKGDSVIGFIFCKTRPSSEMRKSFIRVHSNLKEVKENTFYFETKR